MNKGGLPILENKQLELVVLYADLVGSTKSVKNLDPNQVRRFYTIFLNEMTYVINDFGGRILKYVGDCVIGFFGLPSVGWIPQIDNSVLCALIMQKVMTYSISPIAQSEGLPPMSCRIGMDYGEVQVVNIGVKGIYTEVDVFGDAMNIAKKICDEAQSREILIGKNLWQLIYTSYKMRCQKKKSLVRNGDSYDLYSLS